MVYEQVVRSIIIISAAGITVKQTAARTLAKTDKIWFGIGHSFPIKRNLLS